MSRYPDRLRILLSHDRAAHVPSQSSCVKEEESSHRKLKIFLSCFRRLNENRHMCTWSIFTYSSAYQ